MTPLPTGKYERFYLSAFMEVFGAKWNETVELTDLVSYSRIVSKELFTDHKSGRLKILKEGRAPYVCYIADAIKNPDEIWIVNGGHGDRTMYCLARYTIKRDVLHIITAFKEDGAGLWVGWSGFQSFAPSYYQSKRHGEQIYQKP